MNFIEDVIQKYAFSKEAIIELDELGGRTVHHYSELFARALGVSGALAERGIDTGDTVAIATGTRAESAIVLLACLRMGAVAQFIETDPGGLPVDEQLTASGAVALVAPEETIAGLATPPPHLFGMADLARIFDEDLPQATPVSAIRLDPGAPAIASVRAGDDGSPEIAWRSQAWLQRESREVAESLGYEDEDLVWWISGAGAWEDALLPAWLAGAKALFCRDPELDPVEALARAITVDDFETEEGSRNIIVCADDSQIDLFPTADTLDLDAHFRLAGPNAVPAGALD